MTDSFIHELAIANPKQIGARTRIWQYVVIGADVSVGSECNICSHVFIEDGALIGDRVTVKSGVQVWSGVELEDDVFVGPNVSFSNDKFPRSGVRLGSYPVTRVKNGASIGAGSTILPGLTIGCNAMVGAGSVVTKSVPDDAIVYGNPARIEGYLVNRIQDITSSRAVNEVRELASDETCQDILQSGRNFKLGETGASILKVNSVDDIRGSLCAIEANETFPFEFKRIFAVHSVPSGSVRGQHAHKCCHQFLICLTGSVTVMVDNVADQQVVRLNDPGFGIYIPPRIWGEQYEYSSNAVLLVLASHDYDSDDYIRDYDQFRAYIRGG